MVEHRVQRRLAAILVADVVGYSRMMDADEAGTLARLKAIRADVLDPKIEAFQGRVFKNTGDGAMAEFASSVDAVQCAVDIQNALTGQQAEKPDDQQLVFRIGISQGDVIVEGEDLFGNGVNVAARMEGLAEPGGICISGNVREHVGNSLDVTLEDMGDQTVKNVDRPVRCYRVHPGRQATSDTPLALPDKPSIAVLPFENMSGDPEQEYFADGIAEDIITALSRFHWFFVIARNSSFTYKGRAVNVKDVARELGVQYVLEGSVRKSGNRVRITGQLIEAESGRHLWADRFDGELADIFDLQDKITESVVGAVEPKILSAEIQRARRKRPDSLVAYDYYLRALPHVYRMTQEDNAEALRLLHEAIKIDPSLASANAYAAWCYEHRFIVGWPSSKPDDVGTGVSLARAAIDADRDDPTALSAAGFVLAMLGRDMEAGLAAVNRSLEINSSSAQGLAYAAWVLTFTGDQEKAIKRFELAMRMSPLDPLMYQFLTGASLANLLMGRFEKAASLGEQARQQYGGWGPTFRVLAASYGQLGRSDAAQQAKSRLLELDPSSTVSHFRERLPFQDQDQFKNLLDGLRKAGLPE